MLPSTTTTRTAVTGVKPQAAFEPGQVPGAQLVESLVDELYETGFPAFSAGAMRLQEPRAHHRRQGQCDDRRDRDRRRQGEGEFDEQRAGEAALKADGHEYSEQHHGHGDDRARQFARPPGSRRAIVACRLPGGGSHFPPR